MANQINLMPITRRNALKGLSIIIGTVQTGTLLATIAPTKTYAIELAALEENEYAILRAMIKTAFPQKRFNDDVYNLSIKDFDSKMVADESTKSMIKSGIATLAESGFEDMNDEDKLAHLQSIQDSDFFVFIRSNCIVNLYSNPLAFEALGYEGEVLSKGGYLNNGFQDIKWLPDPPESASPSVNNG